MIGILIFGVGFVFLIVMVLSLLVSPALAPREKSAEDAGSEKCSSIVGSLTLQLADQN